MARVFLALPHNGTFVAAALPGIMGASVSGEHAVFASTNQSSLLACNFNRLWAKALNQRAGRGLTHFAMHHADVSAPEGWLDTLLGEMARHRADLLSVVVPIKDGRGLTTTGVFQRQGGVRRLTMREVMVLPATFGREDLSSHRQADGTGWPEGPLVVNTGLWVCRLDLPQVERLCFRMEDGVARGPDGAFRAVCLSEDWRFSLEAQDLGLRVLATRAVPVKHFGPAGFTNDAAWGEWETDRGDS
jgi:hypothetical protein